MSDVDEALVEAAALEWFAELGYAVAHGLTPDQEDPAAERRSYRDVVLVERLRAALARINPKLPPEAREEATRLSLLTEGPGIVGQNQRFHTLLADGVAVEFQGADGATIHDIVWLADFARPERNDWLVANQVTIIEGGRERRPDILIFVNGLPLAVIELKNPADDTATIHGAFNQFQTYKRDIPALFPFNEALIVSDGREARVGTLTADWERFMPWKTVSGDGPAPLGAWELETLIKGVFEPSRFLDLVRHFVVFEVDGPKVSKKMAAYHQFHAVNKAVEATVLASAPAGDKRAGVVWHTQGSGKSLTMAFYAGKIVLHPAMRNPTLVVLTDRNDLDDQLFGAFAACKSLLRQTPEQAENREHLRELLRRESGGVIFTTVQKFLPADGTEQPALSTRRNIVFIADEAHRSQYGFKAHLVQREGEDPRIAHGIAKHMRDALPNASYIGFTGTPIELGDRSTQQVFGDYIDIYDIQQAVEDGATVPIYYEGRYAKLALDDAERPRIDPEFEEITEGEEVAGKARLMSRWAQTEKLVGAPHRVALVASDLTRHAEARMVALQGKVLIVCMSRAICAKLYDAIVTLRPEWHDDALEGGAIKVVMTGAASDPPEFQPHIRSKAASKALARRLKDPTDPLKLVIVRDMWLTGFDAPCLHTMYVDKPMKGHGLMQAIARVNRVFKDKPGGLVVDYLGLADQLRRALADYTERDREETAIPQDVAVALLREKMEVTRGLFHGYDYALFFTGGPAQRLRILPGAIEHVLLQEDGKKRLNQAVAELARAFALAAPAEEALALRDEIAFFQAVRATLMKVTTSEAERRESLESAINQLVSRVVVSDDVVDIFAAAGLKKPEISILSDQFLDEVRELPQRNLALELLKKLLNDEIRTQAQRNVVLAKSFADLLEAAIRRYRNRGIEAAQVIQELVDLAKDIRAAARRGEQLGLTNEELAFYDALGANDSAVQALGDETLKAIARELVETVRRNVTIDWTVKESVRARLRSTVKRLLRKYGYPPDKQEEAVKMILRQTEVVCKDWVL
ncbi:MAG TPA: type I restriction endonuclease subunit R [Chloroflexota bacterium]|nr:type I restriction endonuclease subunit R [Chloroflexota bacterium]